MKVLENQTYGPKDICNRVGISNRQLEYWVLIGVVEPLSEPHGVKVFRRFTQEDLEILLQVKKLTDEGVLVSRAAEKVKKERKKEEPL
jgi:DNA-binding transcriptional MerR regulator